VRGKDYLMLPLALLIYPVQWVYVQFVKHAMPVALRHAMYPFSCLLYRHYFLFARNRRARPRKHQLLCKEPVAVAPLCRLGQKISPGAVTSSKGQIGRCTLV
jgi:hypothetical protein